MVDSVETPPAPSNELSKELSGLQVGSQCLYELSSSANESSIVLATITSTQRSQDESDIEHITVDLRESSSDLTGDVQLHVTF